MSGLVYILFNGFFSVRGVLSGNSGGDFEEFRGLLGSGNRGQFEGISESFGKGARVHPDVSPDAWREAALHATVACNTCAPCRRRVFVSVRASGPRFPELSISRVPGTPGVPDSGASRSRGAASPRSCAAVALGTGRPGTPRIPGPGAVRLWAPGLVIFKLRQPRDRNFGVRGP